jgi:hypothetical protein
MRQVPAMSFANLFEVFNLELNVICIHSPLLNRGPSI